MTMPMPRMVEELGKIELHRIAVVTECTKLEGGNPRLGSAATIRRGPRCGTEAQRATPTA